MEYEFKLPVCGKELKWRPLRVQQALDERAALKGISEEAVSIRLLMKRIFWYDGKEGCPQSEWGAWDELDLEFFGVEVQEKEGARRAALRKATASALDPQAELKNCLTDLQQAAVALGRAATAALEAAAIAEQQKDPLGSAQT